MIAEPTINVLIVDDEIEACENLRNILTEFVDSDIRILGIANSTFEAEEQIARLKPDAVFLDIEMPNENAFKFLDRIAPFNFEVTFVTAYDEYALKAFRLNAVDYILKPISIPELIGAVAKLRERIKFRKVINKSKGVSYSEISGIITHKTKNQKITLKDGNNIEVVDFRNIFFIEAQGSYSRILFSKYNTVRELVMSVSLADYEEMLPTDIFYRIHKSYLINCGHVKKILRDDANQVVVHSDFTLPISRRRFAPLLEFLKNNDYYDE